jgi:hypothetical protein
MKTITIDNITYPIDVVIINDIEITLLFYPN